MAARQDEAAIQRLEAVLGRVVSGEGGCCLFLLYIVKAGTCVFNVQERMVHHHPSAGMEAQGTHGETSF